MNYTYTHKRVVKRYLYACQQTATLRYCFYTASWGSGVTLSRGNYGSESITVEWTDIGFSNDQAAVVRDLWARKDLGIFIGSFI